MKWKCRKCHHTVESIQKPSERYELTRTVAVPGLKNTYQGIPNNDTQLSAHHYGPVCFGGERGEDYYEHDWVKVHIKKTKK